MPSTDVLYRSNSNLIELVGLYDEAADTFENSATCTVTLVDNDGTEIAGETWPLAMAYVTASDGNYQATIADTIDLSAYTRVRAQITANAGAGKVAVWDAPLTVRTRVS